MCKVVFGDMVYHHGDGFGKTGLMIRLYDIKDLFQPKQSFDPFDWFK